MTAAVAVPLLLSGVATGLNLYSAYGQMQAADDARELQLEQIRTQQVQLRLQENQSSIERMKKLRSIIATEEVTFGARNIAPESSNIRAIVSQNFENFEEDQTAERLNYAAKQHSLDIQSDSVNLTADVRKNNALLGFAQNEVSLGLSLSGYPSKSLLDSSAPVGGSGNNPFNLNR